MQTYSTADLWGPAPAEDAPPAAPPAPAPQYDNGHGISISVGGPEPADAAPPAPQPSPAPSGGLLSTQDLWPATPGDTPAPPAPPKPDVAMDVAKAGGSGLLGGAAGMADQLSPLAPFKMGAHLGASIVDHLMNAPKMSGVDDALSALPNTNMENVQAAGLDYQPQTTAGKFAKTAGEFAPNVLMPEDAPLSLLNLAPRLAKSVVLPAVASEAAGEGAAAAGAPDWAQAGARMVGGGLGAVAPAVGGGVVRVGKVALAPYAARFSTGAAEAQAGQVLANAAHALPAVRDSLADAPREIVPGSIPTTFQQTGDVGLGALERGVSTRNPAPFAQVRGAQNAARVAALGDVQSGADPLDVAKMLKAHYDDLDTATNRAVQSATSAGQAHVAGVDASTGQTVSDLTGKAQGAVAAIGGTGTPEGYGADLRSSALDALAAAKGREGALWDAVDPTTAMTGNISGSKSAAAEIVAEMPKAAEPMEGKEAAIFEHIASMPNVSPVSELIALRSRVSAEMRRQQLPTGDPQSLRRLTMLRNAIHDNLGSTISDKFAADDAAVNAGTIQPADSVAARVQTWADDFKQQQLQEAHAWSANSRGAGGHPLGGPVGSARLDGATLPSERGPGGSSGDQGLPSEPVEPTFDPAAAERLAAATAATKTRAQIYQKQPLASLMARNGGADQFRLTNGAVPAKVFHPGPKGFDDLNAYLQGAGGEALPVVQEYAASSLRKAALLPDGTLDPARFARWQAQHADALRALPPEARARFADAVSAGQEVADAAVARAEALKQAQADAAAKVVDATAARTSALKAASAGPAGKLMTRTEPEDVTRAVGTVLGSSTSVADMRALANAARADPNAMAGLRQAVADHITSKFLGNTEAGASGVSQLKADGYQTFMRQNRAALSHVFTPDELSTMDAIAADIRRSKMSETALKNPGGSNTAQDTHAAAQGDSGKGGRTLLDTLGGAVGGAIGHHFGGMVDTAVGVAVGSAAAHFAQQLRTQGIQRVDQLVTRAMVDPTVARALLARVPAGPATSAGLSVKMRALISALSGVRASATPPMKTETPASIPGAPLKR